MKTEQKINKDITLEDIALRKRQIKEQLSARKVKITQKAQSLFTPAEEYTKWDRTYNLISNALAVYDGVRMGFRVMNRFRILFGRRR